MAAMLSAIGGGALEVAGFELVYVTAPGGGVRVGLADAWALRWNRCRRCVGSLRIGVSGICRLLVVGHRLAPCRIRVVVGTQVM